MSPQPAAANARPRPDTLCQTATAAGLVEIALRHGAEPVRLRVRDEVAGSGIGVAARLALPRAPA